MACGYQLRFTEPWIWLGVLEGKVRWRRGVLIARTYDYVFCDFMMTQGCLSMEWMSDRRLATSFKIQKTHSYNIFYTPKRSKWLCWLWVQVGQSFCEREEDCSSAGEGRSGDTSCDHCDLWNLWLTVRPMPALSWIRNTYSDSFPRLCKRLNERKGHTKALILSQ